MAETYGPIFTIKLGFRQVLVVSSGEVAKECFTTNDKVFASQPKAKAIEIMAYNYAMFGVAPYGDYWRKVRKIIMLEILSQKRVEMLGHVRVSEGKGTVSTMKKEFDSKMWRERERESRQQQEGDQLLMYVLISILQDASEEDFPGHDHDTVIKATCLLVYLDAVIKETLRLYPAAPLSVPHESMEDCVVSGYNIPKGTRLFLNMWKMHRDPNIWADPYSQKDIDLKGNHFELLPFGSGRRMCPGIFFALEILHLTLANVIQQFVINKPSNEPIDMSESPGAVTNKATPLKCVLLGRD
ncbi:hypothetical protein L1987_47223 [Smallanthus sonchifolius]|uniref:Uncharacterized protein n=1 Tax=Smallanthus sonchifolius TaxID=185202 RepID=A0ACB9G2Z4_9ASTR|nr:hypothetical protein L1987_47223 [Smallanthus sonchifolius]